MNETITTKKQLQLTFENAQGKKHRFTPKHAREDITPAELETAMEQLRSIAVFEKNGVPHCTKVISGYWVETITTMIFDKNIEPLLAFAENQKHLQTAK